MKIETEGVVISYDIHKGFGFIKTENDGQFFFHKSNVVGPILAPGDQVCFRRSFIGKRGLQADLITRKRKSFLD